jgi:hypothetical protein
VAAGRVRENRENEISIHHFIGRRLVHGLFLRTRVVPPRKVAASSEMCSGRWSEM